jgi:tetratricopeptide (TPR) repeat protein
VARVIEEIFGERPKKTQLDIRVLEHLKSYAEYQFGDRAPLKAYRERLNGECMDNFEVEIGILLRIYNYLENAYSTEKSLSMIDSDNLRFPYFEKMLDLMRPWTSKLDSNSTSRMDSPDKSRINSILYLLSTTERNIGTVLIHRNESILAEGYCQQALSNARSYKGTEEHTTDLVCKALKGFYNLRTFQQNYVDALPFAEEAYDLVAIVYNPVHPRVQDAAGMLINCHIYLGDLYNAERFAEATLDSLKDPANGLDQESEEVANGYHNLANVINIKKGDFVEAEILARESLRIRTRLYDNDHVNVGVSCHLLGVILMSQYNLGDETMELFERSLANDTKNHGPDGTDTALSNLNLGVFYCELTDRQQNNERKIVYLHLSKAKSEEAVRIFTKIFGPNNPQTKEASSQLSIITRKLSEA